MSAPGKVPCTRITRIVSGGQTGADTGGLEAAIYCSIPHGGWCPKGRKQEKRGRIPEKYHLVEMPSDDYTKRTEANVVDSDATLVFTLGPATGGSLMTIECARKHRRPVLHIDLEQLPRSEAVNRIIQWFDGDSSHPPLPDHCVLNVAGSRASKSPGIDELVMVIMIDVISRLHGKMFYPLPETDPKRWIVRDPP